MSSPRARAVSGIGIDFDNTLVSYDAVFHRVALEQGRIPAHLPPSKLAVREHLRGSGREHEWTAMQGYVYGARMREAEAYPGALQFLAWARGAGIPVSIVSHKTLHPFAGPQYDLHAAARGWIEASLRDAKGALVEPQRVFFEITQQDKLRRVAQIGCDYFIDDLPEILAHGAFPQRVQRILFDPERSHGAPAEMIVAAEWGAIRRLFEEPWNFPG